VLTGCDRFIKSVKKAARLTLLRIKVCHILVTVPGISSMEGGLGVAGRHFPMEKYVFMPKASIWRKTAPVCLENGGWLGAWDLS
jgi:hypothetical protein